MKLFYAMICSWLKVNFFNRSATIWINWNFFSTVSMQTHIFKYSNVSKKHCICNDCKGCGINWTSGKGSLAEDNYWYLTKCYINYHSEQMYIDFFFFAWSCAWSKQKITKMLVKNCLQLSLGARLLDFFSFFPVLLLTSFYFISIVSMWKIRTQILNVFSFQ